MGIVSLPHIMKADQQVVSDVWGRRQELRGQPSRESAASMAGLYVLWSADNKCNILWI